MPRVPVYNQPQVQSRAAQFVPQSGAAATPEAFGASIGRAGQQLAAVGMQAADTMARDAVMIQQEDDRTAAKEALNDYQSNVISTLWGTPDGQKAGLLSMQGKAAMDAGAATVRDLEEQRKVISSRLASPGAQKLFDEAATGQYEQALNHITTHVAQQRKAWQDGTSQARINNAINAGALAFQDTGARDQQLRAVQSEIWDMSARNGWSPEQTRDEMAKAQSKFYRAGLAQQAIADPIGAKTFLDQHRNLFTADDALVLDHTLKAGVTTKTAQSIADRIISGRPPGGGDVAQAVADEATKAGIDPALALTTAQLESSMGAAPDAPGNSHKGVFQLGETEWATHAGGADRGDRGAQVKAGISALKSAQGAAAKALGRTPEAWEVYLTHQQGVAGGPALLAADADAKAVDVLKPFYKGGGAEAAITSNGGKADMTAGQFRDLWKARYAKAEAAADMQAGLADPARSLPPGDQPAGATDPAAKPSLAAWMAQARTISDPDVRQHVESLITTEFNRREAVIKEGERQARDEVWKAALDPKVATVADIPAEKWAALTGETQRSVMTYLENKAAGKTVTPTQENQEEYYRLVGMASQDPAAFADLKLDGYINKLPQSQWQQLVNVQASINRTDVKEAAKTANVTRAMSLLKQEMVGAGLKPTSKHEKDAAEVAIFQGRLAEELTAAQDIKKGKLDDAEILDIGRRLLTKGTVPGSVFGSMWPSTTPLFKAVADGRSGEFTVPYASIPKTEIPALLEAGRKKLGRDPSQDEIAQAYTYITMKGRK